MDQVLYDSLDRLLGDISTPDVTREIEAGGTHQKLWQQISESGFADALVGERAGGAGLGLDDAVSLFFLCGRHALSLPLAQTMVVRGVCASTDTDAPDLPITISPVPVHNSDNAIDCRNVPFGRIAQWILVSLPDSGDTPNHVLLPKADANVTDTGVNGSLQAHLLWQSLPSSAIVLNDTMPWLETAAAITSGLMAGAMDTVLKMTVRYASDRVQFGRPIGKFQAIQQQLSVLAELAAASGMAAELGCQELSPLHPNPVAAAVAKARASEAAGKIVSIAHGVHAAMGVTAEYDLQLFTRRLIEWRTDYGSAGYWNRRVGDAVLATEEPTTLEFILPTFFPARQAS